MHDTLVIADLSDLPSAAKQLLQVCEGKKIFAFKGEMGAGKTTIIKTICEVMGVKDAISSPTFSIVNEYRSSKDERIFHFDFYRIKSINEAYDMGYEDYFYSDAYCFIEWPEKIEELLPPDHVKINILVDGEQRKISLEL